MFLWKIEIEFFPDVNSVISSASISIFQVESGSVIDTLLSFDVHAFCTAGVIIVSGIFTETTIPGNFMVYAAYFAAVFVRLPELLLHQTGKSAAKYAYSALFNFLH